MFIYWNHSLRANKYFEELKKKAKKRKPVFVEMKQNFFLLPMLLQVDDRKKIMKENA